MPTADPARARPRPCALLLPVPARNGTRRIATAGTERAPELPPALRGLPFINQQHPGCSPLAPSPTHMRANSKVVMQEFR